MIAKKTHAINCQKPISWINSSII